MVNVMVFAPSPDLMEPMQKMAQEYAGDEVNIDVIHRFGTPEILWQLDRYDVIVARGITYNKIRDLYPHKHITQLVFDGLDVLEALRRCRETYHPARLGLCLDRDHLQDLVPAMEEVCGAKIRIYDVQDEETAIRTAETCQADGMDALVSGGTVYNFCRERGVPCTYVHLRMETLRRTLAEAMKAAHSINTERTKSNIIRMILDNSEDAVMAVDESGRVLEANNQAYRLYHLAFLEEWKGQSVEKINDALTFIGSKKSPCRDMARKVAGTVRPMVWSIMLLMVTQLMVQKVTHWNRRAVVPMAITSGSFRKRAMRLGAKKKPKALTASRKTAAVFRQNQKPCRTRL